MKYFATVAGKTVLAERTSNGMVVGEREVAFGVEPLGTDGAHLRFGTHGARVTARRIEGGWAIRVGGREHAVFLEDERARAIREITGVAAASGTKDLRAPMPGLVVKVLVKPGQEVGPGDALIVVEAMKMENELRAEAPGIVERVEVTEGRTVERDEVLIRFGEEDE